MNEPLAQPRSQIARVKLDYVKTNATVIATPPVVIVPSRPFVQTSPSDINIDLKEPIWRRKRRQFWKCGPDSIWRTPLLIAWYCALGLLLCYEMWLHLGPSSELYRHNAAVTSDSYYAAHGIVFPIHSLVVEAGKHAGWRQVHLEEPSIRNIPPSYAASILDMSELELDY